MAHSDAPDVMTMCVRAQAADPLDLDEFFDQHSPVVQQPAEVLLSALARAVEKVGGRPLTPVDALAALRDLDLLLCVVQLARPGAYKEVPGVEALLLELGSGAGHIPRGSNLTYGMCNPLDERMRLFTGRAEERGFVAAIESATRHLDELLRALVALADHALDSPAALDAAQRLEPAWEPMIGAAVAMLRTMPPEVFSLEIVRCFVPLDVGGTTYQGVTGAQTLNVATDYLLWGADHQDQAYLDYAHANLAEQLPPHRHLVAHAVDRTGGASLLTHIERQLTSGSVRDLAAAGTVLEHLQSLLRRIGTFRKAHRRLVDLNLPLRATPTGSGGHTVALLQLLTDATLQARGRTQALREAHLPLQADRPVANMRKSRVTV